MNWIITLVIASIVILVPAALIGVFASGKDTYTYQRHYGENGYSQELQTNLGDSPDVDTFPTVGYEPTHRNAALSHGSGEPPVLEWPPEL